MIKNAPVTAPTTKVATTSKAIFHRLAPFIVSTNKIEPPPKAIFFDAAGTLFHLPRGVGYHYALVANELGLKWDSAQLDRAFQNAWNAMPRRVAIDGPRENDDKDWWRELVDLVVNEVAPSLNELDRDNFFEIAYEHFAEAGVWELFPEVLEVLENLAPRFQLAVVSNFDGRLRMILEQLGVSKFFRWVFISSELGADKPDPEIFRRALKVIDLQAKEVLHVGDDPDRDWRAATAAGLSIFELDRKRNSLRDLLSIL
jgi:putative hydrolase of the HAD superfamily